jgi:hypothetical protein
MQEKLRVFLGSSSETSSLMRSLEAQLSDRDLIPIPWQGSFGLARNTLDVKAHPNAGMEIAIGGALRMSAMRLYNEYIVTNIGGENENVKAKLN